jgi:hypothetical protein
MPNILNLSESDPGESLCNCILSEFLEISMCLIKQDGSFSNGLGNICLLIFLAVSVFENHSLHNTEI